MAPGDVAPRTPPLIADREEALEASRRVERRQALLGTTARRTGSMDEFYHVFSARIAALVDYWQTASHLISRPTLRCRLA
jgi:hypothetical protein